ncbi:hypothetical protein E1269_28155 [Jiangella asiatica]|uniref:Fibronectin type-III domain-containing protein n=2 Tax=Jiangella asiatica TaxID=2530372 RepID=A0A4R5CGW3_9ACTN|nr:hypothetical protein E1269_28155 [Jiangella asiatica]
MPTARNQTQGLLFEQNPTTFTRFDVFHDGNGLRLFASSTVNGSAKTRTNQALPELGSIHLWVTRTGNSWTLRWSADGQSWTTAATFTQAIELTRAGPHAGNAGGSAATAHTALVDYIFDPTHPVDPEDGHELPPDNTSPVISAATVTATATSASVQWQTNEAATGAVDYGTTTSYGSTASHGGTPLNHTVTLDGLEPATTYSYRIGGTDLAGNAATPVTGTFTTAAPTGTGDEIDLWYGTEQSFGSLAHTQRWVNIVGNVANSDNLTGFSYRLNGGPATALSVGPDNRRLQNEGDFNIDIARSALATGQNTVRITAAYQGGHQSTATITVTVASPGVLTLPRTVTWSSGVPLQSQAQVVDGLWALGNGTLRTGSTGYDRLVAVGDERWTDYEVTVPMTVHGFGPDAYSHLSGAPMIGIGVRWQGHTAVDSSQPAWDWFPAGAYSWYRFFAEGARWELRGNGNSPVQRGVREGSGIAFGATYVMKVRVQSLPQGARYSMKWWRHGTAEPTAWTATIDDADSVANGSIVLIAHQLDATFGNVEINSLTGSP